MRIIFFCGLLTFLPVTPSVTGQELDRSLLLRLGAAPVLGVPGTAFERDFRTGGMGTLGVGVPISSNITILATFDHASFKMDQPAFFGSRGLGIEYVGHDVTASITALTMQARGDIQLPLGLKGYVSAGPGWMWWRTGGIRTAMLIGCRPLCSPSTAPDADGFAVAVGFGLRIPDNGSDWFFIESQYTHGFFADAPTYLPIRFGWEIAL